MNEFQFIGFLKLKNYRTSYIESFDTHDTELQKKLIEASKDINLQSIRIHKYVTHNGTIGKVVFARFLDSIGLDEQTRIKKLNISNIKDIVNFIENI
tara:strand:+ start:6940 stop:7230 length:291 start_codon:yes stop_codon:yes gene_type:complete